MLNQLAGRRPSVARPFELKGRLESTGAPLVHRRSVRENGSAATAVTTARGSRTETVNSDCIFDPKRKESEHSIWR